MVVEDKRNPIENLYQKFIIEIFPVSYLRKILYNEGILTESVKKNVLHSKSDKAKNTNGI